MPTHAPTNPQPSAPFRPQTASRLAFSTPNPQPHAPLTPHLCLPSHMTPNKGAARSTLPPSNLQPVAGFTPKVPPMAPLFLQKTHLREYSTPKNPIFSIKNPNTPPVAGLLNLSKGVTHGHSLPLPSPRILPIERILRIEPGNPTSSFKSARHHRFGNVLFAPPKHLPRTSSKSLAVSPALL